MKALSSKQVFYQGQLQPATVLIDQGLIVDVITGIDINQHKVPDHCLQVDYGDLVIMPGLGKQLVARHSIKQSAVTLDVSTWIMLQSLCPFLKSLYWLVHGIRIKIPRLPDEFVQMRNG